MNQYIISSSETAFSAKNSIFLKEMNLSATNRDIFSDFDSIFFQFSENIQQIIDSNQIFMSPIKKTNKICSLF